MMILPLMTFTLQHCRPSEAHCHPDPGREPRGAGPPNPPVMKKELFLQSLKAEATAVKVGLIGKGTTILGWPESPILMPVPISILCYNTLQCTGPIQGLCQEFETVGAICSIEESLWPKNLQLPVVLKSSKSTGAGHDVLKFRGCQAPTGPVLTQVLQLK